MTASTSNIVECTNNKENIILPSLTTKLFVHLPFDGNVNDVSGFTHNGKVVGTPEYVPDRFGYPNRAIYLNKANKNTDYIELPSDLYFDGDCTVCVWVYKTIDQDWGTLLDAGAGEYRMNIDVAAPKTGGVKLTVSAGPCTNPSTGAKQWSINTWHHILVMIKGITCNVYLDGINVLETTQCSPKFITPSLCFIGRLVSPATGYLSAKLDDFRIYKRALTPGEISTLVNYNGFPYAILSGKMQQFTTLAALQQANPNWAIALTQSNCAAANKMSTGKRITAFIGIFCIVLVILGLVYFSTK